MNSRVLRQISFVALLLCATFTASAQDPNFYIFLCLGQSNMEGPPTIPAEDKKLPDDRFQMFATVDFPALQRTRGHWYPAIPPLCRPSTGVGPADYFGRALVAKLPAPIRVGVLNVAVAGAKIEVFDPARIEAYAAAAPVWMKPMIAAYGGNPYQRLLDSAREAKKAGVIKGILLHQGESNTGDETWPQQVKDLYARLLHDLDLRAEDVPLIAGEVVAADQQGKCAAMNAIIDALPKTIPTAHVVSANGCQALPDHLHFTPAGYRTLGARYAETILPLLGR